MLVLNSSLDWGKCRIALDSEIKGLPYNRDLRTMLSNIDSMVADLSKLEVEARRTKKKELCSTNLKNINQAINTLRQWIVMAALIG
jgi:hypothetical protein